MNALWARLGEVRQGRLAIAEQAQERQGSGVVEVDRPDPLCIVWEERGVWNDAPGHEMPYRDRLRWAWDPARGILALHHARRGDDAAVHLGDLAERPDGTWRSVASHRCGNDEYKVRIELRTAELFVEWTVSGPKKAYTLRRHYR